MVKGVGVKATSGVRGDPPLVPVGRGVSSAAGKHWTIYVLYELRLFLLYPDGLVDKNVSMIWKDVARVFPVQNKRIYELFHLSPYGPVDKHVSTSYSFCSPLDWWTKTYLQVIPPVP